VLALSGVARAAEPMVTSANPQSLVDGFMAAGYRATAGTGSDGDPYIDVANPAGGIYRIDFYRCQNHVACGKINLSVDLAAPQANERAIRTEIDLWNDQAGSTRMAPRTEGRVHVTAPLILLPGGISQRLFVETFKIWIDEVNAIGRRLSALSSSNVPSRRDTNR
jgi:hypothetical protein